MNVVTRAYQHRHSRLIGIIGFVVAVSLALAAYSDALRRIADNQRRIIAQQAQIDMEAEARSRLVCKTAANNLAAFRKTIAVLEDAAPSDSVWADPDVSASLERVLAVPLECAPLLEPPDR